MDVQNCSMKDLTIDWALRATWQAVTRMYNEEAKNYGLTMAIGFTLLSIDSKKGTANLESSFFAYLLFRRQF